MAPFIEVAPSLPSWSKFTAQPTSILWENKSPTFFLIYKIWLLPRILTTLKDFLVHLCAGHSHTKAERGKVGQGTVLERRGES